MIDSLRIVIYAGVLTAGCIFSDVRACDAATSENVRLPQTDEALLADALDDEQHFLHRRALLERLRVFAVESNDRDRIDQIDRLVLVHERRHEERMRERLEKMSRHVRQRMQTRLDERHEREADRARRDRRGAQPRLQPVPPHDGVRNRPRDRADAVKRRVDTHPRRAIRHRAAADGSRRGDREHDVNRDSEALRDRAGLTNRALRAPASGDDKVKQTVEGRRPVPAKRRPPGPGRGGLARPDAGGKAAPDNVSRRNADALFEKLVREIASE